MLMAEIEVMKKIMEAGQVVDKRVEHPVFACTQDGLSPFLRHVSFNPFVFASTAESCDNACLDFRKQETRTLGPPPNSAWAS